MTPSAELLEHFTAARIVPVLTVHNLETAAPLAAALERGGLTVLEVTLRTPAAFAVIGAMKKAAPRLLVGAGTVLTADDAERATEAGADFLVSPGMSPALSDALRVSRLPAVPGVATVSEAMACREEGYMLLKLFPAENVGGTSLLKSMAAPLPDLRFMPTGGITLNSMPTYLALPNVIAVGGSWLASADELAAGAWDKIEENARVALAAAATAE